MHSTFRCFISYSHIDKKVAKQFLKKFQTHKVYEFFYDQDLIVGSMWKQNLNYEIQRRPCFIAFISNAYNNSPNCQEELNLALQLGKYLILITLDVEPQDCGKSISKYHMIKAPSGITQRVKDEIINTLVEAERKSRTWDKRLKRAYCRFGHHIARTPVRGAHHVVLLRGINRGVLRGGLK